MTLRQFEIFTTIVKFGNLTRASEELHTSQPAISLQMKMLEEYCGTKLFTRTSSGMQLTAAGRQLLLNVRPILDHVSRLKTLFAKPGAAKQNPLLKVAGTYAASVSLLPSLIARFRKLHSEIAINHKVANLAEIDKVILRGEAEIALSVVPPKAPQLTFEPYRAEKLAVLAGKNHRLARKKSITLQDLQKVPLVVPGTSNGPGIVERQLQALEAERGLRFNVVLRCEAPETAKQAIAKHVGLGILFEDVAEEDIKRNRFIALKLQDCSLEGQTCIVYRRDRNLSEAALAFLQLLRNSRPKKFRDLQPPMIEHAKTAAGLNAALLGPAFCLVSAVQSALV